MRSEHRPWPVPKKPWLMKQNWHTLLFAHWPVNAELVKPWIPPSLKLDLYDGQAWIGIVPFYMDGIRFNWLPRVPGASRFAELNVRTYVTVNNRPGVYFFSLDAAHWLAVQGARKLFHLPYHTADIAIRQENGKIHYDCTRQEGEDKGDGDGDESFQFQAVYHPVSPTFEAEQGTLDYWLTERYCLYTEYRGQLYRGEILHEPWLLQHAEAVIQRNTMISLAGLHLSQSEPLFHYAHEQEVLLWGLEKIT